MMQVILYIAIITTVATFLMLGTAVSKKGLRYYPYPGK